MTTVREPFSPQFPCSQRITSIKSVSFATRAEKAGIFQAPQALCEENSFVGDAAVLRLPGILSLPGIMLNVTFPGKNEQSIEQLSWCHAGRICALVSLVLVQCLSSLAN